MDFTKSESPTFVEQSQGPKDFFESIIKLYFMKSKKITSPTHSYEKLRKLASTKK